MLLSEIGAGAGAAARFDGISHQDKTKNEDSNWYEPAWAVIGHDERRHLQATCTTNIGENGISPYSTTTLTNTVGSGEIGTGWPGLGADGAETCRPPGNQNSPSYNKACPSAPEAEGGLNPTGDRCRFPQCNSNGIQATDASTWHGDFDNWNGHATAPAITDNGGGTYTYSFTITSPSKTAISHGE